MRGSARFLVVAGREPLSLAQLKNSLNKIRDIQEQQRQRELAVSAKNQLEAFLVEQRDSISSDPNLHPEQRDVLESAFSQVFLPNFGSVSSEIGEPVARRCAKPVDCEGVLRKTNGPETEGGARQKEVESGIVESSTS